MILSVYVGFEVGKSHEIESYPDKKKPFSISRSYGKTPFSIGKSS